MRLFGALLLATLATAASAHAAADVAGVWAYGEGQVSIVPRADGSFVGTVIKPTSFSGCAHPVGQKMWPAMRRQPDGQYFGHHKWIADLATCDVDGGLGPAAWRVLRRPDGSRFLRVCSSSPSHPEAQPTIAPDGTHANAIDDGAFSATGPCSDSNYVGPVAKPTFQNTVVLPSQGSRKCRSRRNFRIRLRSPKGDPLVRATVKVNGKQVRVVQGARLTAPVDLRGLPKGRYTVSITATTTLGRTVKGSRKYRTCAPKRR